MPGGKNVMAEDISDSHAIVGCDQRKAGGRGFVEKDGKFTVLADPKAGAKGPTCPLSITNRGVVAGDYGSRQLHGFVFSGTAGDQIGFSYHNGKFQQIAVPHAKTTLVACISERGGLIVGDYRVGSSGPLRGFTLRNGVYRTLRAASGKKVTLPQCGNGLGEVVGYVQGSSTSTTSFLFTPAQ